MNKIKEKINIKDSSLNAYKASLKRIQKIQEKYLNIPPEFNETKIKNVFKTMSITSRKNILTSIIVTLKAFYKKSEKWDKYLKEEDSTYRDFYNLKARQKNKKRTESVLRKLMP